MRLFVSILLYVTTANLAFADNLLTDTFLQPSTLHKEKTGWQYSFRLGLKEGSAEIQNTGYRMEIPRVLWQKNVNDDILFRASVPYVFQNNTLDSTLTIGDPTFLTTLQAGKNSTFTVGVTEPAANRSVEPDVVRFLGYFTQALPFDYAAVAFQVGVEITDRFGLEGQDDLLSFGLSSELPITNMEAHLIRKQVVDGKWWDITNPLTSDLNRTNFTLAYNNLPISDKLSLSVYSGLQKANELQYIFGIMIN